MNESTFISNLIKQNEGQQIEFIGDYNLYRVAENVCSFLNSEGGWILVGYDGKNFQNLLVSHDHLIREINDEISNHIFPQPLVDVRNVKHENHSFILINVIRGSRQPYAYMNNYFIRVGEQSKSASSDDISLLLRNSGQFVSTWEKQNVIDATIDDLYLEEIKTTIFEAEKFGKGKSLPIEPIQFMNYFQLSDMNRIKNGCMVLFGKDPIRFISQCQIRITVMPFGKTGSRFDDTLLIEDNLFKAYNRVENYFKQNLPLISNFSVDDWDRTTREKYPKEALDEAILNAMVHRDYADISGEITINIYSDKIEIINSGEIPPNIIDGKNDIRDHHSILRNPTIAHMFYLRGKIEKLGRGLNLIKERFVEYGLKVPEWSSENGYTKLILHGTEKLVELNDRTRDFLLKIKIGQTFTRDDFEKHFKGDISERTARIDLNKLMDTGLIEKKGDGPATKYLRTNKELPEITG